MLFKYILASTLVVSIVFGHGSSPTEVTYEESEVQAQADQVAVIGGVELNRAATDDSRMSDLKYVLAIQKSSIWTDIKQRSLTISTNPRLTEILNESPENLSNNDLKLLKKACHDGLKCVAVDQLLILRSVTEISGNNTVYVRKVITKITQVLTKYTTEYYEDTYQYEEVSETDDPSKVNETVTVILEDNKELCKLKLGNDSLITENETLSTTVSKDEIGTVTNYNINRGNVASATINDEASDKVNVFYPPNHQTPNSDSDKNLVIAIIPKSESEISEPINQNSPESKINRGSGVQEHKTRDHGTKDQKSKLVRHNKNKHNNTLNNSKVSSKTNAQKNKPKEEKQIDNTKPKDNNASTDTNVNPNTDATESNSASPLVDASSSTLNFKSKNNNSDNSNNKSINLANGNKTTKGAEDNGTMVDIASVGDSNKGEVRKGMTEDGVINNGDMKLYNINRGTINKAIINRSSADRGIINVGTLNNGPTNYGTANDYENYGTNAMINSFDMQQYLISVDKMYSAIMDSLSAK